MSAKPTNPLHHIHGQQIKNPCSKQSLTKVFADNKLME